jgi:hypothetical protein
LAKHICTLFSDSQLATLISKTARIEALKRHDKDNNAAHLREIYSEINNLNKNILD